jgi:carboxyl-terminal processing protease
MPLPFINKFKKVKGFIAGILLTGTFFLFVQAKDSSSYFEISKNLDIFATLFKQLDTYYVDPIEPGKLVKVGIDAMLNDLDPYTNYITESDIEDYEFMTTGKYGGIGANIHKKGDDTYVGDVYENSPAQRAGLHPGDLIEAIGTQPLNGKTMDDISLLLKGAPGTQVSMKIKNTYTGAVTSKIITRGEIELSSVAYAGFVGPQGNIGYVKLTQFTQGCGRIIKLALDSLKGVKPDMRGVVLDLRNNPGGLLDEAVNVCNLFVDRGQLVVSTKGKMPEMDKSYKTQGNAWDTQIPLTVLVNHSSASASEIVAGTMQDLDRGIVIGERSYGKGLVQTTYPLGYNARLKLTIAKYYTPSGRCIQALDYTHRNANGSVGYVPDSLKIAYKTKNGRKVLSGGGVEPDVKLKEDPISQIVITLYTKNYFFDYASDYAHQHTSIAPPDKFSLTDAEFSSFAKWLDGKNYAYKTETEYAFDSLKHAAEKEKYYSEAEKEFDALRSKISHDKKQDLVKFKDDIMHVLENEIASRYYYQRGRIAQALMYDKDLSQALTLIQKPESYRKILDGK